MLAISVDEPAASRSFAGKYGIKFPLLSDAGGAVSQRYVGLNDAGISVPGIVVIRRTGEVVFRQVATAADDRLTAADVIGAVDRSLGTRGESARRGYAVLERWQLRFDAGGGALRVDDRWRPRPNAGVAIFFPYHRLAMIGFMVRGGAPEAKLETGAAIGFRLPILADAAAIELIGEAGFGPLELRGHAGGRLGAWVALNPRWALQIDAGIRFHDSTAALQTELFGTFGIARLIER